MNHRFRFPSTGHPAALSSLTWAALIAVHLLAHGDDCVRWVKRTDAGAPEARAGHVMAYDSNRGVTVMFGGHRFTENLLDLVYFRDTWEYDGTAWRQITIDGPSPLWRSQSAMCYDSVRREMVLVGGHNAHEDENDGYLGDTWVYRSTTPGHGVWIRKTDINDWYNASDPRVVAGHELVFNSLLGRAVLFGGTRGLNSSLGSPDTDRIDYVLEWDGEGWNFFTTMWNSDYAGPTDFAMVYDSDSATISICGGAYYHWWGEYDEWKDLDWPSLLTINRWSGDGDHGYATEFLRRPLGGSSIGHRRNHAAAYDSHRKRIVIFGGHLASEHNPPELQDPGSRHDEAAFVRLADGSPAYTATRLAIGTPPPRELHAMVYDTLRQRTVLFGGSRELVNVYNDTWEYGLGAVEVRYVDRGNSGAGDGSLANPHRTVRQAVNAAAPDCASILSIHAGDYAEGALSIPKSLRLEARNGPVRLH